MRVHRFCLKAFSALIAYGSIVHALPIEYIHENGDRIYGRGKPQSEASDEASVGAPSCKVEDKKHTLPALPKILTPEDVQELEDLSAEKKKTITAKWAKFKKLLDRPLSDSEKGTRDLDSRAPLSYHEFMVEATQDINDMSSLILAALKLGGIAVGLTYTGWFCRSKESRQQILSQFKHVVDLVTLQTHSVSITPVEKEWGVGAEKKLTDGFMNLERAVDGVKQVVTGKVIVAPQDQAEKGQAGPSSTSTETHGTAGGAVGGAVSVKEPTH